MYPGVQVTRSLGDLIAHHIGVTSEPEFVVHDVQKQDTFMTLATDSVWKMLDPTEIGDIVAECHREESVASEMLRKRLEELNTPD